MFEWIEKNWISIIVPLVVFLSFIILSFWIRFKFLKYISAKLENFKWIGRDILLENVSFLIFYWTIILGTYIAVEISPLKDSLYVFISRVLLSGFFLSLIYALYKFAIGVLNLYTERVKKPLLGPFKHLRTFLTISICLTGLLIIFEVWRIPTKSFFIFIVVGSVIAFLTFRENILNFISGFEIINSDIVKKGDYIRLESAEEGTVTNVTWRHVEIRSFDEKLILIPNHKFIKAKLEILRKPPKKAKEPFRFYTRLNLKELTGLKAKNLKELLDYIKKVPNSVIFYHTHDFIEEYQYLVPQPSNEFALWIGNILGYEAVAEKLSTIDIYEFSNMEEIRKRISDILEEYINSNPSEKECDEGEEFHFIKSVSVVMPTPYIAHDLREFVQILKFISPNSLFFHIYEARLRLGKVTNDFSLWLKESLGEEDLAEKIINIDPYMDTIENIREKIVSIIEEHLETEEVS